MANLLRDLGHAYFVEFMQGALITVGERNYRIGGALETFPDGLKVQAWEILGTPITPRTVESWLPAAAFDSGFAAIAPPTLGYRSYMDGQVLLYLSRNFSTRRGLQHRDMTVAFHGISVVCSNRKGINLGHFMEAGVKEHLAFNQTNTTLEEGFAKIARGELVTFCITPDFAVAPSNGTGYLDLLFKQRVVGSINEKGNIELSVPSIKSYLETATSGRLAA